MRHKFENMMIKKLTLVGLFCCVFGMTGCVDSRSYLQRKCEDGICTSNQEYTAVCYENADGYSECTDAGDINYTRTAADYRRYGERAPRDYRITQAGAGNNISASVPPSIDDEVMEYEARTSGAAYAGGNNGYDAEFGLPVPAGAKVANAQTSKKSASAKVKNGKKSLRKNKTKSGKGANIDHEYDDFDEDDLEDADEEDIAADEDTPNKDWLAEEGQSLKELLTQWSEESGWRLIWKTNRNYTLNAGAMFRGNFADVSSALIRAFARARPAPIATFYKGNRVLVIETMEDENAYD